MYFYWADLFFEFDWCIKIDITAQHWYLLQIDILNMVDNQSKMLSFVLNTTSLK